MAVPFRCYRCGLGKGHVMRIAAMFALICMAAGCGAAKPVAAPSPMPSSNAARNGKMIFTTGKDAEGFQIMAQRAPLRTSCAACHKANGSGGVHLPGGAVSADLRARSLVTGRQPYNLTLLERAIST